jgi:hypothetical protein
MMDLKQAKKRGQLTNRKKMFLDPVLRRGKGGWWKLRRERAEGRKGRRSEERNDMRREERRFIRVLFPDR